MERAVFDNEKFISLVEPNPCLWDTAHPDYCDRNKKQQRWVEIAKQMCDNFEEMTAAQQNEYDYYKTTSNFTEENHTIEEASDHEQNEYVTPLRPIHVQKKRKVASETDHNTEIVGLLKANLAQRQTNDIMLDNDGDRHFLLSLLPDFRRVPIDKKMDVKLAMIQSIKSALLPTQSAFNYNHV
ncbi:unnamed protein product [Acanthoscelides obtectus]|uniref:MADF domain-containing protein n=1 Tax=Acanthoscelides obtectus TaxID=200917 RepID=A0A9P0JRN9_ACAOB|nr:unnamed protein product [Acanthoscelides obtectus]CAK1633906.1 hypothetical protein AOBTE_LOCUS8473 [Acanthoscelides obtectus]